MLQNINITISDTSLDLSGGEHLYQLVCSVLLVARKLGYSHSHICNLLNAVQFFLSV